MTKFLFIITISLLTGTATQSQIKNNTNGWSISVLPSSLRLDPVTNKIIEERFTPVNTGLSEKGNLLEKNWIYDGDRVKLKSGRGEYISFQLVITNNNADSILKNIKVEIHYCKNSGKTE